MKPTVAVQSFKLEKTSEIPELSPTPTAHIPQCHTPQLWNTPRDGDPPTPTPCAVQHRSLEKFLISNVAQLEAISSPPAPGQQQAVRRTTSTRHSRGPHPHYTANDSPCWVAHTGLVAGCPVSLAVGRLRPRAADTQRPFPGSHCRQRSEKPRRSLLAARLSFGAARRR